MCLSNVFQKIPNLHKIWIPVDHTQYESSTLYPFSKMPHRDALQSYSVPPPSMGHNVGCLCLGALKGSEVVGWQQRAKRSHCDALAFSRNLKYSWYSKHLLAAIMPSFFYTTIALLLDAFDLIKIPLAGYATTPRKWEGVNKKRQMQHPTFFLYTKLQQNKTRRLTKYSLSDFVKRYSLFSKLWNTLLGSRFWIAF